MPCWPDVYHGRLYYEAGLKLRVARSWSFGRLIKIDHCKASRWCVNIVRGMEIHLATLASHFEIWRLKVETSS